MFIWSYVSKSVIIRLFYVSKSVKICMFELRFPYTIGRLIPLIF